MKKAMFALLAAITVFSTAAQAVSRQEAEDECRALAADDGVTEDEMKDYLQECVDSIVGDEGAGNEKSQAE